MKCLPVLARTLLTASRPVRCRPVLRCDRERRSRQNAHGQTDPDRTAIYVLRYPDNERLTLPDTCCYTCNGGNTLCNP